MNALNRLHKTLKNCAPLFYRRIHFFWLFIHALMRQGPVIVQDLYKASNLIGLVYILQSCKYVLVLCQFLKSTNPQRI